MSTTTLPKPGSVMPDGTIYAGELNGEPIFTTPEDAPLTYTFDEAAGYAASLDAHGHKDWRPPSKAALNVLFQNRAAIGNFDTTGSYPAGWYWSSSRNYDFSRNDVSARAQNFSDGFQYDGHRYFHSALRCVRG